MNCDSAMKKMTLHHYYFAEKQGNLIGLLPNSSTVVNVPGPFLAFENRVLKTPEVHVLLPEGKEETSRNPPLRQSTINMLKTI